MNEHRRRRHHAGGRLALTMMAGALAIPSIAVMGRAQADDSPPEVYEARAEAGAVTDSLSVPSRSEASSPYSLSEAQNRSSHGLHAVLHPGLLLGTAAFQQGFSPPPGTTETLYPQGPLEGQADVVPLPAELGGGSGSVGRSSGRSDPTGSSGQASYGEFAPSPDVSVQFGQARTSTTAGSVVRSTAEVLLQQVRLAGFAADSVTTVAEATADGSRGGATTSGSVILTGATLMGTPVTLTPSGLTVGGTTADAPDSTALDELLAGAGVSVRRLPDTRTTSPDGTESRLDLGGVEVRFGPPGQEPSSSFVLGRASVRARSVRSTAAPGIPPEVPSPPVFTPEIPTESELFPGVAGALLSGPLPAARPEPAADPAPVHAAVPPTVAGETIVAPSSGAAPPPAAAPARGRATPTSKRGPARAGDWPLVAAIVALAIPVAFGLRRVLRSEDSS